MRRARNGSIRTIRAAFCVACATVLLLSSSARGDMAAPHLPRFMTAQHEPLREYRALRRMHARSERLDHEGWMDAWTELDARGFRFRVVREGGSESVRTRVFRNVLEREQELATEGDRRGALTEENYAFGDPVDGPDGLVYVPLTARRKDPLLVHGRIVLSRESGDLLRIEGRLAKNPSFWTSSVHIVRHFAIVDGVRVPIALESVAKVKIVGQSTMAVAYEYESINGRTVPAAARQHMAVRVPAAFPAGQ